MWLNLNTKINSTLCVVLLSLHVGSEKKKVTAVHPDGKTHLMLTETRIAFEMKEHPHILGLQALSSSLHPRRAKTLLPTLELSVLPAHHGKNDPQISSLLITAWKKSFLPMAEAREQQATGAFGLSCWYDHEIWQLHGSVKLKTLKFRPEAVMNMAYNQSTTQQSLYHLKT